MTTIKNGLTSDAEAVIKSIGSTTSQLAYEQVKSDATNWTNTDYLGADIFSVSNGAKNTVDTGNTDAIYNSTSDYFSLPDLSGVTEFIIIEATNGSIAWSSNDCVLSKIESGKWILYCDTGTDSVHRAQIHKSLWYGTDGTDALIDDFTSVTAVKTSHSNDVGKQAHYSYLSQAVTGSDNGTYTGTFVDTSTNDNCSSWSNITQPTGPFCRWEMPSATTLNTGQVDEFGIDTSGDEKTNPATCQLEAVYNNSSATGIVRVIILSSGDITWLYSGSGTHTSTNIDYFSDNSIPLITAAGTLTAEFNSSITITTYPSDTIVETNTIMDDVVPDSIVVYGKVDLPTNTSITVDVSDDGGSTWSLTGKSLNTYIDTTSFTTGDLALKFNLATTDTSVTPKLYGYGVAVCDS